MFQKILGLILLTPTALVQMDSVRPDISFKDSNDRFDVAGIVSAQNKMFRDTPLVDDEEDESVASDADYRRDLLNKDLGVLVEAFKKTRFHSSLRRREEPDFAYDPDNLSPIGRAGDDGMLDLEFQENLHKFQMNIPKRSRRNAPNGDQNVVPIVLKADGYLKAP